MNKLEVLEQWEITVHSVESFHNSIDVLMLCPDSPVYQAGEVALEAYTRLVKKIVGDTDDWLGWYRFENDMGSKAMEAGYPGKMIPIITVKDLLEVIEQ